jgi:hypothetical protein
MKLSTPHLNPKLEDHPSLAVCDLLFNIFTATLYIGGRSSICNLRTCNAVVKWDHLSGKSNTRYIIGTDM